jgi:hypothetical protein
MSLGTVGKSREEVMRTVRRRIVAAVVLLAVFVSAAAPASWAR